jgi:hypothetical protein
MDEIQIINELNLHYDVARLWNDCRSIIETWGWGELGQIGLTHQPGVIDPVRQIFNGVGSLSRISPALQERHFTDLNEVCYGTYIEEVYRSLPYKIGRFRLMRVQPRRCYSIHCDSSMRLHLPLITNPSALMLFPDDNKILHLPADGRIFLIDTTRRHSAMNGGLEDRYHLVGALHEE